jgi:hypothetical protein
MSETTEPQNMDAVDPVFPRFFRSGDEPRDRLVGLIAYGLYEEARREWVDDFKAREGRYPTAAELLSYQTSWTSSRLESLKNAGAQVFATYADSVAREIETQALRRALRGGFFRSVMRWLFSAIVFCAAVLGAMVALSRTGVDPVGPFLELLRPPKSNSIRQDPGTPAPPASSSLAPDPGTTVGAGSPSPARTPGTAVTPSPRSGR